MQTVEVRAGFGDGYKRRKLTGDSGLQIAEVHGADSVPALIVYSTHIQRRDRQ